MKLVYAVDNRSYNGKTHVGVRKKVEAQIREFERNNIQVTLCEYIWRNGQPQIKIDSDTDVLYFRRIEPSVKFIFKLRELKKVTPNIKMIMEIPTYPFEGEEDGKISIKNKINRFLGKNLLKRYIDRIVITAAKPKLDYLYGVQIIEMMNGVDFSSVELKETYDRALEQQINLITVSGCFFWHGYERLIMGILNYYEEKDREYNICLHIVGDGPCIREYKEIVKKNKNIEKRIIFYGNLQDDELDEVYNIADIGIDVLALHRKGMTYASSLKSKEYVAKGLPIITAMELDIEEENTLQYIYKVPSNEDAIDMENVIDFYNILFDNKSHIEISKLIRQIFELICDWKVTMRQLIDYILR